METDQNKMKEILKKASMNLEEKKKIEKIQYMMNFGEFAIQYDFCLN